jgi:hypothetical protein
MIEPGLGSGTWIQVIGESLAAGQQVVTEGAERLRAFQAITIMDESAAAAGQSAGQKPVGKADAGG